MGRILRLAPAAAREKCRADAEAEQDRAGTVLIARIAAATVVGAHPADTVVVVGGEARKAVRARVRAEIALDHACARRPVVTARAVLAVGVARARCAKATGRLGTRD